MVVEGENRFDLIQAMHFKLTFQLNAKNRFKKIQSCKLLPYQNLTCINSIIIIKSIILSFVCLVILVLKVQPNYPNNNRGQRFEVNELIFFTNAVSWWLREGEQVKYGKGLAYSKIQRINADSGISTQQLHEWCDQHYCH